MVNKWTDVTTAVSTAVMAIGTLIAIVVAIRQLSASKKQAQVQHLLSLVHSFLEEPMIRYRTSAAKKWQLGETDTTEMLEVMNFFEEVGLLVRRGYLYADDVWEMFGYSVFPLYWTTKEIIADQRKTDPNAFSNFTYLFDTLQKIEKAHSGSTDDYDAEVCRCYWREEANVSVGAPLRKLRRARAKAAAASGALFDGSSKES